MARYLLNLLSPKAAQTRDFDVGAGILCGSGQQVTQPAGAPRQIPPSLVLGIAAKS